MSEPKKRTTERKESNANALFSMDLAQIQWSNMWCDGIDSLTNVFHTNQKKISFDSSFYND